MLFRSGIFVLFFAQLRFGKAVGLVWLLAPVLAWAVSRPSGHGKALPPADRAFLLHQATLIWRYFDKFLREEDHYLPPDNWQEQPGPVLARRTSPTNIGMALLSAMAAADLDILPRKRAVELISHILDTVEGLDKWRGHLYNWYGTSSAKPLHPRYVSTVDSGRKVGGRGMVDILFYVVAGIAIVGALMKIIKNKKDDMHYKTPRKCP